jgi:hypothetical protein
MSQKRNRLAVALMARIAAMAGRVLVARVPEDGAVVVMNPLP